MFGWKFFVSSLLVTVYLSLFFAQLPVKENVVERFEMSEIDGDLLLLLREEHLRDDLAMDNSVHRMRWVVLVRCRMSLNDKYYNFYYFTPTIDYRICQTKWHEWFLKCYIYISLVISDCICTDDVYEIMLFQFCVWELRSEDFQKNLALAGNMCGIIVDLSLPSINTVWQSLSRLL